MRIPFRKPTRRPSPVLTEGLRFEGVAEESRHPHLEALGGYAYSDGDPIVITARDSTTGQVWERETEYVEPPTFVEGGIVHFEYYLYRPDTATDSFPIEELVAIRPSNHEPPPDAF